MCRDTDGWDLLEVSGNMKYGKERLGCLHGSRRQLSVTNLQAATKSVESPS